MTLRLRRKLTGTVIAIGLLGVMSTPQAATARARHLVPPRCPNADLVTSTASRAMAQTAVVCLVNWQRTAHGLPLLKISVRLNRSAQNWSNEMVAADDFTHGTDFAARISAVGFDWSSAGENIATGYETPRLVVSAWMASTGHCENILDPQFAYVGTGVALDGIASVDSREATWTQDFGLPMGAPSPSHNYGPSYRCPYHV